MLDGVQKGNYRRGTRQPLIACHAPAATFPVLDLLANVMVDADVRTYCTQTSRSHAHGARLSHADIVERDGRG